MTDLLTLHLDSESHITLDRADLSSARGLLIQYRNELANQRIDLLDQAAHYRDEGPRPEVTRRIHLAWAYNFEAKALRIQKDIDEINRLLDVSEG